MKKTTNNKDPKIYVVRQKETHNFVFLEKSQYVIKSDTLIGAHLFSKKDSIAFCNDAINVKLESIKATNFTKTQLSR